MLLTRRNKSDMGKELPGGRVYGAMRMRVFKRATDLEVQEARKGEALGEWRSVSA